MLAQRSALLSRVCGPSTRFAALKPANASRAPLVVHAERFRLNNLSPAPGSRKPEVRKGRGRGSGLGGTCGFGMRGQKARSGRGVRNGFEGGQMPLYRRLPKLRGIAGGNRQGQPNFVVMNVDNLNKKFQPGEEISLETLKERGFVRASGWRRNLPLKILGNGELKAGLTVKAAAFSESAKQKIEAAGGKAELAVGRKKWTRKGHQKVVRELKAQGKDYATEKRKLRVAKLRAKGLVNKKRAQKAGAKAK